MNEQKVENKNRRENQSVKGDKFSNVDLQLHPDL